MNTRIEAGKPYHWQDEDGAHRVTYPVEALDYARRPEIVEDNGMFLMQDTQTNKFYWVNKYVKPYYGDNQPAKETA